jgi:hypothetical protein
VGVALGRQALSLDPTVPPAGGARIDLAQPPAGRGRCSLRLIRIKAGKALERQDRSASCEDRAVPPSLFGFVWRISGRHQPWIAAVAVLVFLLGTAPLEIQRRLVNDAFRRSSLDGIVVLVLA